MSQGLPPTTNPLAIASVATGFLSLPCLCCTYGFPFNLLGIILGVIAIVQANQDPNLGGKPLAFAGIGLSVLSFVCMIGMMVLGFSMGMLSAILGNSGY